MKKLRLYANLHLQSTAGTTEENKGYIWKVVIINAGMDKNGRFWPIELLASKAEKFERTQVFMLEEAQHSANDHPFGKPPGEIVGWLQNVMIEDNSLVGFLHIVRTSKGVDLRNALVDSFDGGNPDLLQLSVDVSGQMERKEIDGEVIPVVTEIIDATVDVVYREAAGGKFLKLVAARQDMSGEDEMNKQLKELVEKWKTEKPHLFAAVKQEFEAETLTLERVMAVQDEFSEKSKSKEVEESVKAALETNNVEKNVTKTANTEGLSVLEIALKASQEKLDKQGEQIQRMQCTTLLNSELSMANLPEPTTQKLKKRFLGKVFNPEELTAAIQDEKEHLDKLEETHFKGAGDVRNVRDAHDKAKEMLNDFFDPAKPEVYSIKECYRMVTGDTYVTGDIRNCVNLRASFDTTTFAEVLGDSIRRRLVAEYKINAYNKDWQKVVNQTGVPDFRTNRRTRWGGYGDLSTVAEADAYPALSTPGDEEATYAVAKRGGTEDVTFEMIKNDDAGVVMKIPRKMATAAARTLYEFVFDTFDDNANIYDGTALFTTGHGNLGTVALSTTSIKTRRLAMLKQTELSSSKRLGIYPKYLLHPVDLQTAVFEQTVRSDNALGGPSYPVQHDFVRTMGLEPITVIHWTDTNNWYLSADPALIPTIELGFLDNKKEPEIFVQDQPTTGSVFTHDKITYKIRHIYGKTVEDYRGLDGSIVAG